MLRISDCKLGAMYCCCDAAHSCVQIIPNQNLLGFSSMLRSSFKASGVAGMNVPFERIFNASSCLFNLIAPPSLLKMRGQSKVSASIRHPFCLPAYQRVCRNSRISKLFHCLRCVVQISVITFFPLKYWFPAQNPPIFSAAFLTEITSGPVTFIIFGGLDA